MTHRRLITVALAAGLGAAGCSSGGDAVPTTSVAATTTTTAPRAASDGRLVVGILLPTGDTVVGDPMVAAAELAIDRINMAGGVLGVPVSSVVADEGSTTGSATTAIQSLLARDVDVIVGPGSSTIALSTLDEIVSSGTLACSPTASALALDGFPDGGLFFRTVPSDSLQARAIADVADQTGVLQAAIVHIDDSYGRDFADSVEAAIADGSVSVAETITFTDRDVDLTDEARQLLDSGAQVAIVLADDDDGTRFLETLGELDTSALATIVVNDAMRNPTTPQRIAGLDADLRDKIVGLAPQAESADPGCAVRSTGAVRSQCVRLRQPHRAGRGSRRTPTRRRHRRRDRAGEFRRVGVSDLRRLRRRHRRGPAGRLQRPVGTHGDRPHGRPLPCAVRPFRVRRRRRGQFDRTVTVGF